MVRNSKPTGTAMSMPAGISMGVGTALLLTVLGAAIVAWLLNSGSMKEEGVGYGAMGVLLLASAFGSWTAVSMVKHQRLIVGLSTGAVYFVLLLGMTGLVFGGQYQGIIPTALMVLGGSTAAVLVSSRTKGNRTPGRHKIRTG